MGFLNPGLSCQELLIQQVVEKRFSQAKACGYETGTY